MKPLRAEEIVGNWAALLLPINADDSIDYARLVDEIDFLAESGVDGVYSNGTAGEFYAQSEAEFDRISRLLAERCEAAGMSFQLGASHVSPQISLRRVRQARQLRPGAIQVILPDWLPPTDPEAIACLQSFAEAAAPIGLILYNPPHAKRALKPADFATIKDSVPELVGLKLAGGDALWYRQMREHAPDLSLFIPGHETATGISLGADGSYSNVACLNPTGAQRWVDGIPDAPQRALDIERRIQAFFAKYITPLGSEHGFCNTALDKLLVTIGGWADVGTRVRWPYRSVPPEVADRLGPVARELIPEVFDLPR